MENKKERRIYGHSSPAYCVEAGVSCPAAPMKLGFRVRRQLVPEDEAGTSFLLELGSSQVEIRCSNMEEELPKQYLFITAGRLGKVRKRLEDNGIEVSPFEEDPFTKTDRMSFEAPDNVTVIILSA